MGGDGGWGRAVPLLEEKQRGSVMKWQSCPPDIVHTRLKGSETSSTLVSRGLRRPEQAGPQELIPSNTLILQVGPERVSHPGKVTQEAKL